MAIIDRRAILRYCQIDELRSLARHFEIPFDRSLGREQMVDLLADNKVATLGQMLMTLPRRRLKELCRLRGFDDSGREKAVIVTRLLGVDPMATPPPRPVPPILRRRRES